MQDVIGFVNACGSALMALGLAWASLTRQLHRGLLMQLGLAAMALGFLAIACALAQPQPGATIARAGVLIWAGAALGVLDWARRTRRGRRKLRRATDWRALYGHAIDDRRL